MENLCDDIVRIGADKKWDRTGGSSFILVKPIQIGLSLRVDHGSGRLRGILHSVQSTSVQDVDAEIT